MPSGVNVSMMKIAAANAIAVTREHDRVASDGLSPSRWRIPLIWRASSKLNVIHVEVVWCGPKRRVGLHLGSGRAGSAILPWKALLPQSASGRQASGRLHVLRNPSIQAAKDGERRRRVIFINGAKLGRNSGGANVNEIIRLRSDSQAKPNVVSPRSSVCFPPAALATVGRLRALAILLCLDVDLADELVAITLTRASVGMNPRHFELNLSTWLYGRLRGYYYRDYAHRAARREPQADTRVCGARRAFGGATRSAGSHRGRGCSVSEAARICRCPRDRFKQLVNSARATLARNLPARRFDAPKQPATIVALFASAQSLA